VQKWAENAIRREGAAPAQTHGRRKEEGVGRPRVVNVAGAAAQRFEAAATPLRHDGRTVHNLVVALTTTSKPTAGAVCGAEARLVPG